MAFSDHAVSSAVLKGQSRHKPSQIPEMGTQTLWEEYKRICRCVLKPQWSFHKQQITYVFPVCELYSTPRKTHPSKDPSHHGIKLRHKVQLLI